MAEAGRLRVQPNCPWGKTTIHNGTRRWSTRSPSSGLRTACPSGVQNTSSWRLQQSNTQQKPSSQLESFPMHPRRAQDPTRLAARPRHPQGKLPSYSNRATDGRNKAAPEEKGTPCLVRTTARTPPSSLLCTHRAEGCSQPLLCRSHTHAAQVTACRKD